MPRFRIASLLVAPLLLTLTASPASALGIAIADNSADRIYITEVPNSYLYPVSPGWLDPRFESNPDGLGSVASDLDVETYDGGATFLKTNTSVDQTGNGVYSNTFSQFWINFTLTESVSYQIQGEFAGTVDTSKSYNIARQNARLTLGNTTLFEQDQTYSAGNPTTPFSFEFGQGAYTGSITGVLGPGTYQFYSIQQIYGYGTGTGSGFTTLQLGEAPPSTVPATTSTLGLLAAMLAGLSALRRIR